MRLFAFSLLAAIALTTNLAAAASEDAAVAKPKVSKRSAASGPVTWIEPLTGTIFVLVPKGCFTMGTEAPVPPSGSQIWDFVGYKGEIAADEKPHHQVCLDSYWIARHEVRQADWRRIMSADSATSADGEEPMAGVTWEQAMHFAASMTERTGGLERFRLPTEAEWEQACRAGLTEESPTSDILNMAWFAAPNRALGHSSPVARLKANAWGIFDMLGNVWEWTADTYAADAYTRHALFNPHQDGIGNRVTRGGSYRSELVQVRCGTRSDYPPNDSLPQIGFRLVMTRPSPSGMVEK